MGRKLVGRVGENVGINTYGLRTSGGMGFITGVELKTTEKRFFYEYTILGLWKAVQLFEKGLDYYKRILILLIK